MLKITLVDFLMRGLPEAFLFIGSGYLFSLKKIDKKVFLVSIMLVSVLVSLVRNFPINYGVHIIINMAIYILVMVSVNGIDLINAATYSFGLMMLLAICEWINLFALNILLKGNLYLMLRSSFSKNLCFSPSLILFVMVVLLIYFRVKKKDVCI